MSTDVYGATSVSRGALTYHCGARAWMADVEQWDRLGYASGEVELGMQDAAPPSSSTLQHRRGMACVQIGS